MSIKLSNAKNMKLAREGMKDRRNEGRQAYLFGKAYRHDIMVFKYNIFSLGDRH